MKLSPYFSSTGEIARRLDDAGADALVLFNRFVQPDIDPYTLSAATAASSLSEPDRGAAPAHVDRPSPRSDQLSSLAATTGVESATDVAKYLLAGADVVMTASSLLRHGPEHATSLLDGLWRSGWSEKGFTSVDELRGLLAVPHEADEADYERAGYVSALRQANSGIYGSR